MIALSFALPAESRDFVALLQNATPVSREGLETIRGEVHGRTVAVLHTGVGAAAAAKTMEIFLRRQRVDYLISTGFAGALDRDFKVGDLLLAENYSDADLLNAAELNLAELQMYFAQLASVPHIVDTEAERAALGAKNGAVAIDMETAVIADACARHEVKMISLRAISDTASAPFPAPPKVLFDLETQKTPAGRLALYLATHPTSISRLRDFSRQIADARTALTTALDTLLRQPTPAR